MSKNLLTYAQLFLGMAFFGSTLPISKIVTDNFPVFIASAFRILAAILIILPFIFKYKSSFKKISKKDYPSIFFISFSGVFLFSIFMLYGMKITSGVTGSIVMSASPAVTALGAFLFLKDRFDWKKITAIILSVAGIVIINVSRAGNESFSSESWIGILLIFLAVCAEASYTLFAENLSKGINPLILTFITAIIAFLLFIVPSVFQLSQVQFNEITTEGWVAVCWWGIGGMGLASLLWFSGLKKASGSVAAGFMSIMPLTALIMSYIILSEEFRWIHLVSFGLVFIGIILIIISHREEAKKSK